MRIQANGMGLQSFTLLMMSNYLDFPAFDYSIFSDTGLEKPSTYRLLEWYEKQKFDIPVTIVDGTGLRDSLQDRATPLTYPPVFTEGGGMLMRACTDNFKIRVINKYIKNVIFNGKYEPFDIYLGITVDEVKRVSYARLKHETKCYPFVNLFADRKEIKTHGWFKTRWSRHDCMAWLRDHKLPIPEKSGCYICPYMKKQEWKSVLTSENKDRAIEIDRNIRNKPREKAFLTSERVPIESLDFSQKELFPDYDGCESGYCNI